MWVGTSTPFRVRGELAEALGLDEAGIQVIVPDYGGGFGGKHGPAVALEAARLARAADGPVKVAWSREEEFRWGTCGPPRSSTSPPARTPPGSSPAGRSPTSIPGRPGLGGALFEQVDFADGVIRNASLSQYRVPRLPDVPPVEAILVDRPDQPSAGGGETPLIAVAPALANAIRAATGTRLRSLPLAPQGKLSRV